MRKLFQMTSKELRTNNHNKDLEKKFIHAIVQTSLNLRAKCNKQKLRHLTAKIFLSLLEICNIELFNINEQDKQLFYKKFLFTVYNTDQSTTIDSFLCGIVNSKSKVDVNVNRKLFLYIDEPRKLFLFLVIDFDESSTGKVNIMRSIGFDLVKASSMIIKSHSTLIKKELQEFCMLYCEALSE